MSYELSIYKKNRIDNLKTIYNSNVANLYYVLIVSVRNIQNSRQSPRAKVTQINNLITSYNNNVNNLAKNLNKNISTIQIFSPVQLSQRLVRHSRHQQ